MGGLKEKTYGEMLEKQPERLVTRTIKGMLPKTKLGNKMAKKLKVYKGPNHKHEAQQPEVIEL
jgi:large subunit ribosomal protein L13